MSRSQSGASFVKSLNPNTLADANRAQVTAMNAKIATAVAGGVNPSKAQISLIHGDTGSALVPIQVGPSGAIVTNAPQSAFGENLTAKMTPTAQLNFRVGVDIAGFSETHEFGAGAQVTSDGIQAKVESGTGNNGFARLKSRRVGRYHPGAGTLGRFACAFGTPDADSSQIAGLGDEENGYFFGYDGTQFSTLRRQGGRRHIQTFTITGLSLGGNITVTLDGNGEVVATTALGTVEEQAQEIALHDYSGVGQGWSAYALGATVWFVSDRAAVQGGVYDIAAGATGLTYTTNEERGGLAANQNWRSSSMWSLDAMDGTGPSGITLDPSKGNVYQIEFQWLGYGAITFSVANPATGAWIAVDRIEYSNTATAPHTDNPSMPLYFECRNDPIGVTSTEMLVSSAGSFTQGEGVDLGPSLGTEGSVSTFDAGTVTHVMSVRNDLIKNGVVNNGVLRLVSLGAGFDQGSSVAIINVRLHRGGTESVDLVSPRVWSENGVLASVSTTTTSVTGNGDIISTRPVRSNQSFWSDLSSQQIELMPGEYLTVSVEATAGLGHSGTVGLTWIEEL